MIPEDAEWQTSEGEESRYMAEIKIYGNNRTGLLVDVTKVLTERHIDINAVHSTTSKQGIATASFSMSAGSSAGKPSLFCLFQNILVCNCHIVKSTQAKNKINQWFRSEFKEENISKGKELIAQYCKTKNSRIWRSQLNFSSS